MGAWPEVQIADVAELIRGVTYAKDDARSSQEDGFLPLLRATNIQDASLVLETELVFVPEAKISTNQILRAGDIVLATSSGSKHLVGKSALLRREWTGSFGAFCAAIRPKENIDPRYLASFLQSPAYWKQIGEKSMGVNINNLRRGDIESVVLPLPDLGEQRRIVAEIEKQFSLLDEAVANLQRVKANLKRYERATIASLTNPESFDACVSGTVADVAISLDNMRKPVNKLERAKRLGNIPYLGANGQTGWIDEPLFNEELVLVVEDETFVGRTDPFCYYFAGPCWVNNHTHVLRARPEVVYAKYLNLALSYYPFIPLTTGSTGRRKLTKAALMSAPISVPSLTKQVELIDEVERCLSIAREVEAKVDINFKRAQALRQISLVEAFSPGKKQGATP